MVKTFRFYFFFIPEHESFLFAWDWTKSCREDELVNVLAVLKYEVFKALRGIITDGSNEFCLFSKSSVSSLVQRRIWCLYAFYFLQFNLPSLSPSSVLVLIPKPS